MMRRNVMAAMVLLAVLMTACGQATPAAVRTTAVITKTSTLPSAPTPTPSETPFPPLSGNKPYMMILNWDLANYWNLAIYDKDGSGRRIVKLPAGGFIGYHGLGSAVSPDGKWLAFYTGSFDPFGDTNDLPLTLNLLNIADGTTRKVSDVVAQDYRQKLSDLANELKTSFPDSYEPDPGGRDWVAESVTSAFQERIYSGAWSPDSQSLAFAGQIDGLSSDVYLYDMASAGVQRVDDDIDSVWSIQWSPDGKQIVFENSFPGEVYTFATVHVAGVNHDLATKPRSLDSRTWSDLNDWLSSNKLLASYIGDGTGWMDLQTINTNTGQTNYLWKGRFESYAIDDENHVILMNTYDPVFVQTEQDGLYFIKFDGARNRISKDSYYRLQFRGGEKHRFLGLGADFASVFGIAPDGSGELITQKSDPKISVSPDHSWLLIYNRDGMDLYDKQDGPARRLTIPDLDQVSWWPDSQGIFYSTGKELYSMALPSGNPKLVDACVPDACSFGLDEAVWLP